MANIEQAEAGSLESAQDGRETESVLTGGDVTPNNSGDSPAGRSQQACLVKSPIPSLSATPEVSITSSHPSPAPGFPAPCNPFSIPHPKKFNAVNINKTFLQKTSTSSGTVSAVSSHATTIKKSGSPAPRPTTQPAGLHSRLVTAKLTSASQPSTTAGLGWSRPSSATPPVPTTPSNASTAPPPASVPAAPHFPHAGKVIQPQPRNANPSSSSITKKEGSSTKHAWGNAKPRPVAATNDVAQGDFPTAAEVAHGRGPKSEEHKAEDFAHAGQVAPQEADAFRGVHLDPNAHHWDEMEEDDDNFLANVIEFGDGRQYKIASTDAIQAPATGASGVQQMTEIVSAESVDHVSNEPVRQEDRFADDYDRSWPRSRRSPTALLQDFSSRSSRRASTSSTSRHSPVEGPRVLFNERSNRLEPYSSSHPPNRHGAGAGQHGSSRRVVHAEPSLSTESRLNRDAPPHTSTHPVQLLQKAAESGHKFSSQLPRSDINDPGRRHPPSAPPSGGYANFFGQSRARTREGSLLPTSTSGESHSAGDRPPQSSGAPHGLRHDTSHAPEALRDQSQPHDLSSQKLSNAENTSSVQTDGRTSAQSPVLSRVSAVSGVTTQGLISELDIEGVHKATMHISAERARQRRQLEEEERDKERERARKKAAELEVRMRLAEASKKQAQEAAAIAIIQEAVSPPRASDAPLLKPSELPSPPVSPVATGRPRSPRPGAQTNRNLNVSHPVVPSGEVVPAAEQADSWRKKPDHFLDRAFPPSQQPMPSPPAGSGAGADENLEVVDFSDLAKFVGVEEHPSIISSRNDRPSRPARPVASDFFEEPSLSNGSTDVSEHKIASPLSTECSADRTALSEARRQRSNERGWGHVQLGPSQETRAMTNQRLSAGINGPFPAAPGHSHPSSATPLYRHNKVSPPFREAPMSALDDVMSRIKGALDNMQSDSAKDVSVKDCVGRRSNITHLKSGSLGAMPRTSPREGRWLPPALRLQHPPTGEDQEIFDATGCEPPRSPQPTLTAIVVNFPRLSRPTEPVPKRQLRVYEGAPSRVRLDILSWDPPVEGMSRRDLSVNDILFGGASQIRSNKVRYRVALPKTTTQTVTTNVSSAPLRNSAPLSRSKVPDDLASWRKGLTSASGASKAIKPDEFVPAPDVTSCSPPPEPPGTSSKSTKGDDAPARTDVSQVRPRTQPKMPVGSAVGFYRNLGSSTRETKAIVNFTVNSELGESPLLSPSPNSILLSSTTVATTSEALSEVKDDAIGGNIVDAHCEDSRSNKLALVTQVESKSSEESGERSLVTPASTSFSTPWTKSPLSFSTKDSPARGPDPEHLKAVWSQAADKERLPAVNSLEGIADDLTALPFTIQDVKSEDGETPPPTSSVAPSRISLHDVTRAFQRVPSSSNTAPLPPLSPGAGSGPITRPSTFNYVPPLQAAGVPIRQHYAAFPSPMLAHSPSPTLLYPPAASSPPRVLTNSHSQSMNQQGWMPLQTSQSHNGAARHLASPYPVQIMPYPPPNGALYQNLPTSSSGPTQPRPRAVPLMSPIMHPPTSANLPLYNGSPILMHAPMIASAPRPFLAPAPPTRVQARSDGISGTPQQPPQPAPHQPMYRGVPIVYNRQW